MSCDAIVTETYLHVGTSAINTLVYSPDKRTALNILMRLWSVILCKRNAFYESKLHYLPRIVKSISISSMTVWYHIDMTAWTMLRGLNRVSRHLINVTCHVSCHVTCFYMQQEERRSVKPDYFPLFCNPESLLLISFAWSPTKALYP